MHTKACVFINDDESGLHHDNEVSLAKLAPYRDAGIIRRLYLPLDAS